ncbi:MAG: hypothetical protein ABJF10_10730 [Chthoniobacter sp.]|uniref:hypothetical protein n=1 Tax=Chthoniobacter sp. TaxID=2510640 RepID=UPI0032AE785F
MRPAFSSTGQAGAFTLLLLVLLLLPALVGKSLLPPRSDIYASMPWRYAPIGFLHQQIFEEKSDIDIAFVGSSRLWAGIDTPYVQKALSDKLGRQAVVLTMGWAWLGFDGEYFIAQDLLQNRKVKMIVFDDEYRGDDVAHAAAPYWFRFGDDAEALEGMPARLRMSYYFAAIVGMPRNLLGMVRSSIPEAPPSVEKLRWANVMHSQNSNERLGALTVERGINPEEPFTEFTPQTGAQPTDVSLYSKATEAKFRVVGPPTNPWQLQFAKKFAALAKENGCKLVFLHLNPVYSSNETNNPLIEEREPWNTVLNADVTMMGIPPRRLYSGIGGEDFKKLFYTADFFHYNKNGQKYFTPLITPTLVRLYETTENR